MRHSGFSSRHARALASLAATLCATSCHSVLGLDDLEAQASASGGGGGAVPSSGNGGIGGAAGSGASGSSAGGTASGGGADCLFASYQDVVLEDNPEAYWPLDTVDGSGNTPDASTGNHPGYSTAPPSAGEVGIGGGALRFSGSQYFETDLEMPTDAPISLEAWFSADTPGWVDHQTIAAAHDITPTNSGMVLDLTDTDGTLRFQLLADDMRDDTIGVPVASAKVQHAVATFDGSTVVLYLDGDEVASRTLAFVPEPDHGFVSIGADNKGATQWFRGVIDEVAVYDHALRPERVACHHEAGLAGLEP